MKSDGNYYPQYELRYVHVTPPQNPMWKRVLIVLMRVLGWIILIPAVIGLLISGVFTLIASITWDPANFIIWSVISAVFGGLSALGVAMTGVVKGDDV